MWDIEQFPRTRIPKRKRPRPVHRLQHRAQGYPCGTAQTQPRPPCGRSGGRPRGREREGAEEELTRSHKGSKEKEGS